ncbi:hypothetical protein EON76_05235 [bacterium]|nr:MAG: hypothetical protein EON76_05235 [bacterium]
MMKIRNASRKFKTWISALWSPKPKYDWLESHYALMADNISAEVDDETLTALMAKRDRLKRQKKAYKAVEREIHSHKARMLMKGMKS